MIYTLTFNPSLDYIMNVKNFTCGKVNRTLNEVIYPGGKGINVSIVLNHLDVENTALGFCAGFTGEKLLALLQEKNVCTNFISIEEGTTRINVKVRAQENMQEETEINGQGPCIEAKHIQKLYAILDTLKPGDFLVLAGSIPDSLPETMYRDIMEYLKGRDINIVVDATKELLLNVLQFKPFLIKPNHHELGEMFDVVIENKKEALAYAKKLQEKGARNVLVSMSEQGAVFVGEDGSQFETEAPKGKTVYTVGAGDSMVAGFLAGYLQKKSFEKAFQMGVCAGSATAFSKDLATKEEILILFNQL